MPAASLSKPLPRQTLFGPLAAEVEAVAEETSARETNRLLQVIDAHNGVGGHPVYVVGKVRTTLISANPLPPANRIV